MNSCLTFVENRQEKEGKKITKEKNMYVCVGWELKLK